MSRANSMSKLDTTSQIIAAEAAVTSAATKWGMGGGSLAAVYGWLTSSGAAMLIGIIATILGFVINAIYQQKRHRRESEEADFRRLIALAEERRRDEMHKAQLAAIKLTQGTHHE